MSLTEIQKDSLTNKSDMDNIHHNYIFSTENENKNNTNLNHNTGMCDRVVGLNEEKFYSPSIVDINSELLNLNKPLNRDLYEYSSTKTYEFNKPIDTVEIYNKHKNKDISCSTIKNYLPNRWYNLHKNPLDNSIEPFNRIGQNTVLNLINSIDTGDDDISKLIRGETSQKASRGLVDGISLVNPDKKKCNELDGLLGQTRCVNGYLADSSCPWDGFIKDNEKYDKWFYPWLPMKSQ